MQRRVFLLSLAAVMLSAVLLPACTARSAVADRVSVEAYDVQGREPGWLALPSRPLSVKVAVVGDSGTGSPGQHEVAAQMFAYRERFPFDVVLMLGDNIYEGPATPRDYADKFEAPYRALLDAGVRFHAVLGNHDDPRQVAYAPFGMGGERYYTIEAPRGPLAPLRPTVRVFALDSTRLDRDQRGWLARELAATDADWKVCLLHHPLYSSGRYGGTTRLWRWRLEPLLTAHGVDVVFSGHEHLYERTTILNGIQYFISGGGGGELRRGDARPSGATARAFDEDYHFMLVEFTEREMYFQAISRTGQTIDAGVLRRAKD